MVAVENRGRGWRERAVGGRGRRWCGRRVAKGKLKDRGLGRSGQWGVGRVRERAGAGRKVR
eukprot:scaffold39671_cov382-Amphora_coffeaeformis.AAC.1